MPAAHSRRRRSRRRVRRRRLIASLAGALVVAAAAAGLWLALSRSPGRGPRRAAHREPRLPAWIAPWTLVATVAAPTPGYASPDAATPVLVVPPTWAGAPSALPVIASQPGWIQVNLATRPPAAPATWIRSSSVSLSRTPYRIVLDVARTRLVLFRDAKAALCAPAGIGTPQDPTPLGHYFVALLARSPSPTYGPFVVVTSAVASVTTDWQHGGTPIITIEGPLDSTAAIGTTGARITTGAIRLLDPDLERLRVIPPGTPIDVVATLQLPPPATQGRRHHIPTDDC